MLFEKPDKLSITFWFVVTRSFFILKDILLQSSGI